MYAAPSLEAQGFIHASRPDETQLIAVANFLYAGQRDLLVLLIDPARLPAEVRWKPYEPGSPLFPHIYVPVPVEAVVGTPELPPGPDGRFFLPAALK